MTEVHRSGNIGRDWGNVTTRDGVRNGYGCESVMIRGYSCLQGTRSHRTCPPRLRRAGDSLSLVVLNQSSARNLARRYPSWPTSQPSLEALNNVEDTVTELRHSSVHFGIKLFSKCRLQYDMRCGKCSTSCHRFAVFTSLYIEIPILARPVLCSTDDSDDILAQPSS